MPGGTRFRLWPKIAEGYSEPEVVEVSLAPGTIGPGPQDPWMYVANAVDKPSPYRVPDRLPPYTRPVYSPAVPDAAGHFDQIPEKSPQFRAAHLYGAARRVLDLWQDLLGHPIVWWHDDAFPRLELVPMLKWGNAHSGPGFLETGQLWTHRGVPEMLCFNFDVVAHEIGHIILFSVLGAPAEGHLTGAFLAFHEAFADHVAVISALYFNSVAERLLMQTRGNLYALNLISRIGALSGSDQIRVLDNEVSVSNLGGLRLGPGGNWIDPLGLGRDQHAAAAPLSGAIWDCAIELFQEALVRLGAIGARLDTRKWTPEEVKAALAPLNAASSAALTRFAEDFGAALRIARDMTGLALARCIQRLDPNDLNFATVAARFCEALVELGNGHMLPALVEIFLYRDIDPRPLLGRVSASVVATWRTLSPAERLRRVATDHAGWSAPFSHGCLGCRNPRMVAKVSRLIRHSHRGAAALSGEGQS
jgi:hypothetical protein